MAAATARHCCSSSSSQTLLFLSLLVILLLNPPASCRAANILYSGETLLSGEYLQYGPYTFIMQDDCNLVLYENTTPKWASNTWGSGHNCTCTLSSFGNLAIHNPSRKIIWQTNTTCSQAGNYVLVLQRDRNVVIYGGSIWATWNYWTNIVPSGAMSMVTNHAALIEGSNHTALIVEGSRATA